MLQPRTLVCRTGAARNVFSSTSISSPFPSVLSVLSQLSRLNLNPSQQTQVRHASHAQQKAANRPRRGPGKRLGAKRGATELVVPGNIIFKQRGTLWFPGEGTTLARDQSIVAAVKGFVRYYRDPAKHPDRKYIGVVFNQTDKLPRDPSSPRQRRLGMNAIPIKPNDETYLKYPIDDTQVDTRIPATRREQIKLRQQKYAKPDVQLGPGYQYRETNASIGRTADRAGNSLKPYNRLTARYKRMKARKKIAGEKRRERKQRRKLQMAKKRPAIARVKA